MDKALCSRYLNEKQMKQTLKNTNKIKHLSLIAIMVIFAMCSKDEDITISYSIYNGHTTAIFNTTIAYDSITDQDGNVYKTVTIGTQTWMAENLRTTTYNDGSAIPIVTNNEEWADLSTGAFCTYNNTSNVDTIATFGCLYNNQAVRSGKLAPKGWHIPTNDELIILSDYLGNIKNNGGLLKEGDTAHWQSPNLEATNETGFTALPAGYRMSNGDFYGLNKCVWLWSMTKYFYKDFWSCALYFNSSSLYNNASNETFGFSVRCIKD